MRKWELQKGSAATIMENPIREPAMEICEDTAFAIREVPHRIEICEGDAFDASDDAPSVAGRVYELLPAIMGSEGDIFEAEDVGVPQAQGAAN